MTENRPKQELDPNDILRGADAIAAAINAKPRSVYGLIEKRGLPVFRTGRIICARRSTLLEWIARQEAASLNEEARYG